MNTNPEQIAKIQEIMHTIPIILQYRKIVLYLSQNSGLTEGITNEITGTLFMKAVVRPCRIREGILF